MHESIKGFPFKVDEAAASTMKDQMAEFATFQGEIRAVRAAPRTERNELISRHVERVMVHADQCTTEPAWRCDV